MSQVPKSFDKVPGSVTGASDAAPKGDGAAGPSASPVSLGTLDDEALGRLRDLDPGGAVGLVGRIMAAYASSADRLVDQLVHGLVDSDLSAVRHASHTLKSSSASIGAVKFSALCADIETMARAEAVRDPQALAAQVRSLFADVMTDVRQLC